MDRIQEIEERIKWLTIELIHSGYLNGYLILYYENELENLKKNYQILRIMDKYDFNDILICPASVTDIYTRKSINPYQKGWLPIITAPMDTVISEENEKEFTKEKIITCLPRGENSKYGFESYSLTDFIKLTSENNIKDNGYYLIDIANGHMKHLHDVVLLVKSKYPKIKLMVGNIANPETYELLSNAGADYIRVGIGNGGGCLTTVQTGVGYPMASLISECYEKSLSLKTPAKIVADGGMKTYSDIIKALALGADYVMVGSVLNKSLESCGDNFLFKKIKISQVFANKLYRLLKTKLPIYKKFRGMSTKEVQEKWGKEIPTTSEGIVTYRKVEYTLPQWVKNFEDYLRSAMSYSNANNLEEFIGKAKIIRITDNAYNRFNK
jgi:GMP reductase